jgi:peptidoglycan/xylan/chitin deacetylase (PgdA/CDA1 family)
MTPLVRSTIPLGRFTLSLDTEIAWGSFDKPGALEHHRSSYARVRSLVDRMLEIFERHRFAATWAIVGHLFLESCSREGQDHHNAVLQPRYSWHPDWLDRDPFSDASRAPFFYAPDVVDKIAAATPPQEIASHTFTHAILGDPECTREVALSQLDGCLREAKKRNRSMTSLVFPRNSIGHLDALYEVGIRAYRGPARAWHTRLPSVPLRRAGHFVQQALALEPPVYPTIERLRPESGGPWLYNLPASMYYPPVDGVWKAVPLEQRVKQAVRGIRAAVRNRALFHLWFHPFNLGTSPRLLDGLETIVRYAAQERDAGRLDTLTMAQIATRLDAQGETRS